MAVRLVLRFFFLLNSFLSKRMYLVIFGGMGLGLLIPGLAGLSKAVPYLFAYMTLSTALSISPGEMKAVILSPLPVIMLIILLHALMPALAFGISGFVLGFDSPLSVGIVLAAVIPVGVTSVIWTALSRGETPIALATVTLDSLLSPLVVPFSVTLLFGSTIRFDTASMMTGLVLMIVLPSVAGIVLHEITHGRVSEGPSGERISAVNGSLSKIGLSLVVAVNVAAARPLITGLNMVLIPVMLILLVQAVAGYAFGFLAARISGYSHERTVTMIFCGGMRNIAAGIVIALQYFEPATAVPVVLAMLFQQPLAAVVTRLLSSSASREFG